MELSASCDGCIGLGEDYACPYISCSPSRQWERLASEQCVVDPRLPNQTVLFTALYPLVSDKTLSQRSMRFCSTYVDTCSTYVLRRIGASGMSGIPCIPESVILSRSISYSSILQYPTAQCIICSTDTWVLPLCFRCFTGLAFDLCNVPAASQDGPAFSAYGVWARTVE